MAVYTDVTDEDLKLFVAAYDIGAVLSAKGIAEGVENSNYLIQTETGPYILTLYEKRVEAGDLPFFLGLMEHLNAGGLACPLPLRARDGEALRTLAGRPAAIVRFLPGLWPKRITPEHCRELGMAMAKMHAIGSGFTKERPNALSVSSWRPLLESCGAGADSVQAGLADALAEEVAAVETAWPQSDAALPRGVIHADLFPDNVFFRDGRLSGIIDFYFACTDLLAYDLAICLNAWCFEEDGAFNVTKARRLLKGYAAVRPLADAELSALPILARGSALRFCLTRLYDWINHPEGAFVKPKDPLEYLQKLRFHRGVKGPAAYGLEISV